MWNFSSSKSAAGTVSEASGKFYGDFLQERIFKPLEMKTVRIISERDIVTSRAAGQAPLER